MIPWLLVPERLCKTGASLATMLAERKAAYPCSGEINFVVDDARATIDRVLAFYAKDEPRLDRVDGVSATFDQWRFNLRSSIIEHAATA
jgi:phosphomannomutase/phosphoglucomutase